MSTNFYKLMLVTNRGSLRIDEYLDFIKICADSGITSVQLREKSYSYTELLDFGFMLKKTLDSYNIPLIINDNINLAVAIDAAGVHLGQKDGNKEKARALLGADKIIGVSIDSFENMIAANDLPINYVGVGAIFPTKSKTDVTNIWGLKGLSELKAISKHPIIAIGGVDENNVSLVIENGADGIAAISGFHDSVDVSSTIKKLGCHIYAL